MSGSGGHDFDADAVGYEDTLNIEVSLYLERSHLFFGGAHSGSAGRLRQLGFVARTALDYGVVLEAPRPSCSMCSVAGHCSRVESVGGPSIGGARAKHATCGSRYRLPGDYRPDGFGLAGIWRLQNGVFPHISPAGGAGTLAYRAACLTAQGVWWLFGEQNVEPGNALRHEEDPFFDREAIPITRFRGAPFWPERAAGKALPMTLIFFPQVLGMLSRLASSASVGSRSAPIPWSLPKRLAHEIVNRVRSGGGRDLFGRSILGGQPVVGA